MDLIESKIKLTLLNGTGYIFNADDYMELRTKHRITGSMVGTCCSRGWSVNTSSLPVELTTHETQLLLEEGIAVLLSKTESLLRDPTDDELKSYSQDAENRIQGQEEHLREGKVKESLPYIDKIIQGKRKKLISTGVPESEINLTKDDVLNEIRRNVLFDKRNALLQIPCEHLNVHEGISQSLPKDESFKYKVFKDLWHRGKYITCGEAFGADFLLYPGDPLIYHASHLVIVLERSTIAPLELAAKVRLSVIVNKLCVFACLGHDGQISYETVVWKGNKEKMQ